MDNASLDSYVGKDCLRPFLQTAYSIHGEEQNILYTSVFDLVEDLHPLVFAFRFAQPQAAIQRKIRRTPTYLR